MWSLLILGIGLGLMDSLNPFTISTQVIFQPFVKKNYHILCYIVGTYMTYFIGGILVYWGIDKVISGFWNNIMAQYSATIFSIEVILGIILVFVGIFFFFRTKQKKKSTQEEIKEKEPTAPKSVHPVFLFFFGAVSSVGDLPTAFPYLMFIAKVVEFKLSVWAVLLSLGLYCLVYILPLLIIYGIYIVSKKKLEVIIKKVQEKVSALSKWATIALPAIIGVCFSVHGYISLFP